MVGEVLVRSTRDIVSNHKSDIILIILALVPIVLDAPAVIITMVIFITVSIFAYKYHVDKVHSLESEIEQLGLEIEQLEVFKRTGLELDGDTKLACKHIYIDASDESEDSIKNVYKITGKNKSYIHNFYCYVGTDRRLDWTELRDAVSITKGDHSIVDYNPVLKDGWVKCDLTVELEEPVNVDSDPVDLVCSHENNVVNPRSDFVDTSIRRETDHIKISVTLPEGWNVKNGDLGTEMLRDGEKIDAPSHIDWGMRDSKEGEMSDTRQEIYLEANSGVEIGDKYTLDWIAQPVASDGQLLRGLFEGELNADNISNRF